MPKVSANILATDKQLIAAKAPTGGRCDYRIKGAPDLQLRVIAPGTNSKGRKTWCVVYKRVLTGKWTKFAFGSYPAITLEKAKERAKELSVEIRSGLDPILDKRRTEALDTFGELASAYMREHRDRNSRNGNRSRSTDEAQRILDQDILPLLGDTRAELIKRAHVAQVVEAVAKRTAYVAADRVLGLVRSIFNWGIDSGRLDSNPTLGLKRRTTSRAKKRVLSTEEIRVFWSSTENMPGISPAVRDALRLQLLTGLRINEVTEAALLEIDLNKKVWTVPEARTKSRREHVLPLSDFAVEILRDIIAREDAHAERRAERYDTENQRADLLFPTRMRVDPR